MRKKPPKTPQINEEENVHLIRHQKKLKAYKAKRRLRQIEIHMARFRAMAKFFSIIFIVWLFVKLVNSPQWYLNDFIFAVYPNSYLEIAGNQIVSSKQIMNKLGKIHLPPKPIYLLNTKPIEKEILTLTPVKKVYIRRFWFPARLKIVVDEKVPVLSISPAPNITPVAVFTEEKSIITKEFLPLNYPKSVYMALTYDNYAKWSKKQVRFLVYLSELIESVSHRKIKYLDLRNPDDVYAQLDDVKLRLGEVNNTLFARTKRVNAVLSEALKIKDTIDYIDLRWDKSISIKLRNKEMPKAIKEEDADKKSGLDKNQKPQKDKPKAETNAVNTADTNTAVVKTQKQPLRTSNTDPVAQH